MKRSGVGIYVFLLLTLLVTRFAPYMSNRDDFVRYYFGGYVGFVQIRGGDESEILQAELAKAVSNLSSTHDQLRFLAGRTPYVPFFVATTPIGMAAFAATSDVHVATWILGFHTLLWSLGILAGAVFIYRTPAICSTAWFLAAGVAVAWLNAHTSPFLPSPRGVSTLAAGLALASYLSETKSPHVLLLLFLGSFFHPYQHFMNVLAVFLFLFIVWSDRPLDFLRSATTWRIGGVAVLAASFGIALVWLANAMSFPQFTSMLDARAEYDIWENWSVNREAFEMSARHLGPVLLVLVFLEKGWRRALGCAAVFLGGMLAASFLGQSGGFYPGEYVQRLSALWSVILFALLLRRDLFRELMDALTRKRAWIARGILLLCLLFLWKSFDAWNPGAAWKRFVAPSVKEWGPVETECFRILLLDRHSIEAPMYTSPTREQP